MNKNFKLTNPLNLINLIKISLKYQTKIIIGNVYKS